MARVPKADNFQVVPGVRQGQARAVLSPEQAAAPGRRMMQQGQQMMQVGGDMADYAQQQQERVNRVRVQDAYLTAEREALALGQQLQDLKGKDAVGASDAFSNKLQETLGKLEQEIGGDAAKMMFRERAGVLQSRFFESTIKYEAEQLDVYEALVLDATVGSAFEAISQDVANLPSQSEAAREALTQKFQNAGLSGEALDQRVRADMGKLHGVVIDNMLDAGDGAGAKAYFEAVRETDMLEMDADAVANKVNAGAAVSNGRTMVDAFMAGTSMEDLNLVEADAYFRANGTNDTEIDAAREELITRRRLFQEQEKLQEADNYDTALTIANERGLAAARGSAAWQSLRPAEQNAIRDYIESRYETVRSRQAGAETRQASAVQDKQNAAYYDIVHTETGIANLAGMTPGQLSTLRPKVGEANYSRLLKLHSDLNEGPDRVYEATIDNNAFNALALRYGYDPLSKNDAEKMAVVQLRATAETAIAAEQNRVGKLDPIQKQQVIENMFANNAAPARVPVRGGLFGGASPVSTDKITPEEAARIRVSDIPYAERLRIVKELGDDYNKTGDPRTDPSNPNNVRAMYLAERGVGVTND